MNKQESIKFAADNKLSFKCFKMRQSKRTGHISAEGDIYIGTKKVGHFEDDGWGGGTQMWAASTPEGSKLYKSTFDSLEYRDFESIIDHLINQHELKRTFKRDMKYLVWLEKGATKLSLTTKTLKCFSQKAVDDFKAKNKTAKFLNDMNEKDAFDLYEKTAYGQ